MQTRWSTLIHSTLICSTSCLIYCLVFSSHLISSLFLSIFSSQLIFYGTLSRFSFLSFCSVLFNFNFIFVASILYRLNSFYFNSYFCDNFNQLIIHNIPYFIPLLSYLYRDRQSLISNKIPQILGLIQFLQTVFHFLCINFNQCFLMYF